MANLSLLQSGVLGKDSSINILDHDRISEEAPCFKNDLTGQNLSPRRSRHHEVMRP
jgi:hypothetical protein